MISMLVAVVILGVILWLFNTLVTMDPKFKMVVNVLACLCLFVYILQAFGLFHGFGNVRLR